MKGKKMELVALACIYLTCRRNFVNLHPVALEPLADVTQGKILKVCKVILRHIPKQNITPS
jgi:transcription initiation factor TFIIIB Brf1 subunit/transcription initiation factor TFIIB